MNVFQKLNEARSKFHKKALKKSGLNKFAGYSYFELSDFVIPALEIFAEVGLTSVIRFNKDMAEFVLINVDKPDEIIIFSSPMSEAQLKGCHPVQNLGAVQTYISRYLWVQVLHIVEHDALDATTGSIEPEFKLTESKIADLTAMIEESINLEELKVNYQKALKACKTDQDAQKQIIAAKDAKKSTLGA